MKKIYLKRTIQGGLGPAPQREESERDVRILTMLVDRVWGDGMCTMTQKNHQ